METKANIMDAKDIDRALTRIAHEILERNKGGDKLILIGIKTRGYPLAKRLSEKIEKIEGFKPETYPLDITLYRDDLTEISDEAILNYEFQGDIKDKIVVLVDDVIYTGRTTRAALDGLSDSGQRALKVQLAVLIDRGHRELPIRPDFIGKNMPTSREENVKVQLKEIDGIDKVEIKK